MCNWDTYNSTEPNFHTFTGALVGGPDSNDNYVDSCQEAVQNMVAWDFNAVFWSAVAALIELQL
jgi:endoglucanase